MLDYPYLNRDESMLSRCSNDEASTNDLTYSYDLFDIACRLYKPSFEITNSLFSDGVAVYLFNIQVEGDSIYTLSCLSVYIPALPRHHKFPSTYWFDQLHQLDVHSFQHCVLMLIRSMRMADTVSIRSTCVQKYNWPIFFGKTTTIRSVVWLSSPFRSNSLHEIV